jgi:hypothetical protein
MLTFLISLTVVFGVMLITGFVWGLTERGKRVDSKDEAIGAELMADRMARDSLQDGKAPIAGKTWFRGKEVGVEVEAEYSYAEIGRSFRAGRIRPVLPALLGIVGTIGLTFFLGLTLWVALSNKLYGIVPIAFSLYAVYLLVAGMIRAG